MKYNCIQSEIICCDLPFQKILLSLAPAPKLEIAILLSYNALAASGTLAHGGPLLHCLYSSPLFEDKVDTKDITCPLKCYLRKKKRLGQ